MSWIKIKELAEKYDKLVGQAGDILKFSQSENRDLTPEETAQFGKIHADAEEIKKQKEIYETQSKAENSVAKFMADSSSGKKNASIDNDLRCFALQGMGENIAQFGLTGAATSGGELMTRLTSEVLVDVGQPSFGVRQMGYNVIPSSIGGSYPIPIITDTSNSAYALSVGTALTDTADPVTGSLDARDYPIGVCIPVSKFSVRDTAFPLAQHVGKLSNERIEKLFNTWCTTGNGSDKPYGITTSTCSSLGHAAAATSAITADEVLRTIYSLRKDYRDNAKIQCTSATQLALRLLKDENNQYLWHSGSLATGQPDTFAGKPVVTNEAMAELSAGASSKVLLVTDPSFGYIREVSSGNDLQILVEAYAIKGMIGFLTIKSFGFAYTNPAASKWLITDDGL